LKGGFRGGAEGGFGGCFDGVELWESQLPGQVVGS
jgi:hypothetical protein